MRKEIECIEILWDGPHSMEDIKKLNGPSDYGIYQIYGTHNIFGSDCLLYVGKAQGSSFSKRIPEHIEWTEWESIPVHIHVGRLGSTEKMDESRYNEWDDMIDRAERLLIYYSSPPYNSQSIKTLGKMQPTLIINYRNRHRLPFTVTSLEHESLVGTRDWKVFGSD